MNPKQKAEELVSSYFFVIDNSRPSEDILKTSKQCALIAVEEILNEIQSNYSQERIDYYLNVINKIKKF